MISSSRDRRVRSSLTSHWRWHRIDDVSAESRVLDNSSEPLWVARLAAILLCPYSRTRGVVRGTPRTVVR